MQEQDDDYEIEEYVKKMEKIVERKLALYHQLNTKLSDFKKVLREEEEVHHNMTVNKGFGQYFKR